MAQQVDEPESAGDSTHAVPQGYFGGVIQCGDGRTIKSVQKYMKRRHHVRVCDVVTEPGLDARLALLSDDLRRQYDVYNGAHQHTVRAVVGHRKCAGNPTDRHQHMLDVEAAVDLVLAWGDGVPTIGLLVGPVTSDLFGKWVVEQEYDPVTRVWSKCQ